MGKQAGERDDSKGGLGAGGPQDGPVGGGASAPEAEPAAPGEGGQRHPGGSSRDSERLR
ncbi:MAG TPA: hypothetical protein VGD66_12705 [Allosphingosinicella sp.]|jgi:hypothetical protein